ncbi:hypothetical protein M885DRAFT_562275 [Pelagophyceae sp. CCMP2097]|nr:hypothetical protein M885DRAFT_562275 [Pelagophyceae sp. CCMP2097]
MPDGPDDERLAAVVLAALRHAPYAAHFNAACVGALAADTRLHGGGGEGDASARRGACVAAALASAARAMGATEAAAALVAAALSTEGNVAAFLDAGEAATDATRAVLRAVAAEQGLSEPSARVVADRMAADDVRKVCAVVAAVADRTGRGAAASARTVFLALTPAVGPQRWRAGLYRLVSDGAAGPVYARVHERQGEMLESYLFRTNVSSRGGVWQFGSSPRSDAAGIASDFDDAERPEDVRARWFFYDEERQWRPAQDLRLTLMPESVSAALEPPATSAERVKA